MRVEQNRALASLKGRMRGFLQFGLLDDPVLYARELRGLRTQCTRAIVELEKGDGNWVDCGSGVVGTGGAPVAADVAGSSLPGTKSGPGVGEAEAPGAAAVAGRMEGGVG